MTFFNNSRQGLRACGLLALLLILLLHAFALPHIRSATLSFANDPAHVPPENIILPYLGGLRGDDRSNTLYRIKVDMGRWAQPHLELVTRFCLQTVTINTIQTYRSAHPRCNWERSNYLDLNSMDGAGEKTVDLRTSAAGLHAAPPIFSPQGFYLSDALGFLLLLTACTALMLYMRRRTGHWYSGIILCSAFLAFSFWFVHHNFMANHMDMPAHLDYVTYIYKRGVLPPANTGWEFYQPPLFYLIGALIMALVTPLQSFDPVTVLRCFNLLCFMTYLIFAALILRRLVKEPLAQAAALMLLALWPVGMMYATRVDSHMMLYAIMGALLYYLLRWCETARRRDLARVIALFGIGIATRTNIFALAPLCALAALYTWRRHGCPWRDYLRSLSLWGALVIVLIGLGMNFGRTLYYRQQTPDMPFIVGNIPHLNPIFRIQGGWDKYVTLDADSYFRENDWDNTKSDSRHYFWNSLLKTSQTSQFNFGRPKLTQDMYRLVLALSLWVLLASLWYRRHLPRFALIAGGALLFSMIGMLMINRHLHPFGPSQDIRYIYPCLIGFAGIYGLLCERFLKKKLYIQLSLHLTLMLLLIGCGLKLYLLS